MGEVQPSEDVSGDYYDYRWVEETERLNGCIVDLMGQGIVNGLLVSALRVLYRQVAEKGWSLSEQTSWLNRECVRILPKEVFAAALLFEYDVAQNVLHFTSAGIPGFLLLGDKFVKFQTVLGSFLGNRLCEF